MNVLPVFNSQLSFIWLHYYNLMKYFFVSCNFNDILMYSVSRYIYRIYIYTHLKCVCINEVFFVVTPSTLRLEFVLFLSPDLNRLTEVTFFSSFFYFFRTSLTSYGDLQISDTNNTESLKNHLLLDRFNPIKRVSTLVSVDRFCVQFTQWTLGSRSLFSGL